ncbi:hypothetical protein IAR55_000161 [Kwoniella newhampshirensis]|uniref:Palmitoyltransferase n=1 Tax=Kwoniella newhampshirensis TaxID=1651941 RepID=A0AAW0Z6K9_9TREE
MARDWGRVWVGGTVCLISFISFSSQIFVIWPWYGSTISVDLLRLLFPFNCLVFMVFWNYRLCVTTPPGGVPHGWRPNMSGGEGMEVKKGNHAPRYCKTCEHYKPPRAHHCRQCKTCVLKVRLTTTIARFASKVAILTVSLTFSSSSQLDHHCPWIANCVGFSNQGHFIRFLVWVDIATSYHLLMMAGRVTSIARSYQQEPSLSDMLFLIFNFAACVPVWLCVGMFSVYHIYLACGNSTTIEGWEKDKVATLVRRGKIKEIKYPYNIGFIKNIKSVLGPNPLLWLWPQKMRGDGLSFPVNPDAGDLHAQYSWPPQDPSRLPNPGPPPANVSPFVYGNEGFNPNLRPSNSAIRSRQGSASASGSAPRGEEGDYSSGEERDYGSIGSGSRSSSPEPYLSDYDDGDEEHPPQHARSPAPRVRRGSEGWEVRSGGWGGPTMIMDVEEGHEYAGGGEFDAEGHFRRPWEVAGRYNVYVPEGE